MRAVYTNLASSHSYNLRLKRQPTRHKKGGQNGQIMEPMIAELEMEAEATRRLLERIPGDKLDWKPHAKSMSLGQLGTHIAKSIGFSASLMTQAGADYDDLEMEMPAIDSVDEIVSAHEESLQQAKNAMSNISDEQAMAPWKFTRSGVEVMSIPVVGVARTFLLNHLYHHRGQLGVYLRLLDISVPSVYGPSADEDPFS